MAEALVHVIRGNVVEAVHYGDVAVVDHHDDLVFSRGNPENITYLRSAAKPLQAAAALLKSVDVIYDLDDEEVALLCSSHSGERGHIGIAERVMAKLGVGQSNLLSTGTPIAAVFEGGRREFLRLGNAEHPDGLRWMRRAGSRDVHQEDGKGI